MVNNRSLTSQNFSFRFEKHVFSLKVNVVRLVVNGKKKLRTCDLPSIRETISARDSCKKI